MGNWREYLRLAQAQAARIPTLGWLIGGVIAVAFAVVFAMEINGPPYAALYDGLSPADGGKVIAQLQKLGIPYELQGAGNIILVPAPQLAAARLELGTAGVPGDDVATGWQKLEDAPMTASDLAQSTMATQALQTSLEQSIETMAGIQSAQVYLAVPAATAFLGDQPKPTASVVIAADDADAQTQGPAIANLVAGAVPGLTAAQVTVETTTGIAVFPAAAGTGTTQLQTIAQVENSSAARVAALLTPLVGAGNFRTNVSADIDFTQEHEQQLVYGPSQIISHQTSTQSDRTGVQDAAIGIPGAMSNEPPAPTTAQLPPAGQTPAGAAPAAAATAVPVGPHETNKNTDQTYLVGQSENDITKPDWTVSAIAVSVVLNQAALGSTTTAQVKTAIAAAFAYPVVNVSVLAAPFRAPGSVVGGPGLMLAAMPVTRAVLEVLAAAALLFGAALPLQRWLVKFADVSLDAPRLAPPKPVALPGTDFSQLRVQAAGNPAGVARLLQGWVEENG